MIYIVFSGDIEGKAKPHLPKVKYTSALAQYEKLKKKQPFVALLKSEKVGNEYQSCILKIAENGEDKDAQEFTLPTFDEKGGKK